MLRTGIRWAALAALVLAGTWVYKEPKLESWLAAVSALVVFLGSFLPVVDKATQKQIVGDDSTAIQAGGDVHVGEEPYRKKK